MEIAWSDQTALKLPPPTLDRNKRERRGPRTDYPLAYKDGAENSKHRVSHAPNQSDRSTLQELFLHRSGPSVAKRFQLILAIAFELGMRRDSILSLVTRAC